LLQEQRMSTWLVITVLVFALGAATFFLGEWLCRLLIPHFNPWWRTTGERRSDGESERDDDWGEAA
jgi:hypothetical protein